MKWTTVLFLFCIWHSVYCTSPKHIWLLILVSFKLKICVVTVHCPVPPTPNKKKILSLWLHFLGFVILSKVPCASGTCPFTSLLQEGTERTHPSVLEKADVTRQCLALSWQETKMTACGPGFQKDWRTVTGTLGPAGAAGPNFLARILGFKFHDRANFHVRLESVSISAGNLCSVLTPRWALVFWHDIDIKYNGMR